MRRAHIVLFGFPVTFGLGALLVSGFLTYLRGVSGAVIALALLASILVHELGHAFAFRRYGCSAGIVLNGLGGYAYSYDSQRLTNKQHIVISLAGPLTEMILLGIPSLALFMAMNKYAPESWKAGDLLWTINFEELMNFLKVMVFLNVGWALVNLLPLYPLDGGHVLYHALLQKKPGAKAWSITRTVTIVVAILCGAIAYINGFVIAILILGYFIYRGLTQEQPNQSNSIISEAAQRASSQNKPLDTKGEKGDSLTAEAYQYLGAGETHRFTVRLEALKQNRRRTQDVSDLERWALLLDNPTSCPPDDLDSPLQAAIKGHLAAPTGSSASAVADKLRSSANKPHFFPAVASLHKSEELPAILENVDDTALDLFERRLVPAGMVNEQMAISRIRRERSDTRNEPQPE